MAEQISIEEHKKALEEAKKEAKSDIRLEFLEGGIKNIQSDIKEHIIQSKVNSESLQKSLIEGLHGAEQRSIQCQQDLKDEFYAHLSDKYATREYVDNAAKYMKLAAIFGAVSFMSTISGFAWIIIQLGGM